MTHANAEQLKYTPWFAKAGAACSIVPIARFVNERIFTLKGGGYMQSLEPEVRRAINSIHDELMATGTHGPETQPPPPGSQGTEQNIHSDDGLAARESQRTEKGEEKQKVPSRGKVIPFAGKMRANDFEAFR